MTTDSGRLILASGNIFRWEHVRVTGRGGIRGDFVRDPSDADIAEAQAFAIRTVPSGARYGGCLTDERHAKAAIKQHITGGSDN